jgi:uncharacterized protein (TIGR02246 family)
VAAAHGTSGDEAQEKAGRYFYQAYGRFSNPAWYKVSLAADGAAGRAAFAREKTMKKHLVVTVTGLAIGLAMPTVAQRPSTCDGPQDACQQIISVLRQFEAAYKEKDATGVGVLFAADAVVMGEGPMLGGREAIQKSYSDAFKAGWTDNSSPIDQVHVAGNTAWAVGSWSANGPGPNNTTQKYHGNWGAVYVIDGGSWKARMLTWNSIENPG